jgi:hypothetical protein
MNMNFKIRVKLSSVVAISVLSAVGVNASLVGNALIPRSNSTDYNSSVFAIDFAVNQSGTLSSVETYDQGPDVNGVTSQNRSFNVYVLQPDPTAGAGDYKVVYESSLLTVVGTPGSTESFTISTPITSGDLIAHYGQGIPLDTSGGTSTASVTASPSVGEVVPGEGNITGRTYSIAVNEVVAVPEPATIISGLMLLLPCGASTLWSLRRNRAA